MLGGIILGKYNNKNTTYKEINIVTCYCRMLIHLEENRLDLTNKYIGVQDIYLVFFGGWKNTIDSGWVVAVLKVKHFYMS